MVDALAQAEDSGDRQAALVHFVDARALTRPPRSAAPRPNLEAKHRITQPAGGTGGD
jgi:hypothetical protein